MKLVFAVLGLFLALAQGAPAHAGEAEATLSVRLAVAPSCAVAAAPVEAAAPSRTDPALLGTASVTLACAAGTPYALAVDAGTDAVDARALRDGAGRTTTLAYAVRRTGGFGFQRAAFVRGQAPRGTEPVLVAIDF